MGEPQLNIYRLLCSACSLRVACLIRRIQKQATIFTTCICGGVTINVSVVVGQGLYLLGGWAALRLPGIYYMNVNMWRRGDDHSS